MAEAVQRHLESMSGELLEMRRTKLFTEEETKNIVKKRKEFEYRINGLVTKHLADFKDYIEYETQLLDRCIPQTHDKKDKINERKAVIKIKNKIRNRIKTLYEIGLQRFANNFSFWLSYFQFCKQQYNNIGPAAQAVKRMIQNFTFLPQVWQIAADFYARDQNEINTALEILHKGISHHPTSELLYLEAIKLELLKVSEEDDDEIVEATRQICCAKLKTYLETILDNIQDINFVINILEVLEEFSFTTEVQNIIIDYLIAKHSQEAIVWHTLAQREFRDLHYGIEDEINVHPRKSFIYSIKKYKEGLQKVDGSKKPQLYSYYLEFLIQQRQESKHVTKSNCLELLMEAFEGGNKECCLTEKYYISWLEYLSDEDVPSVLEKATNALPCSVELWKLRLRFATLKDDKEEAKKVFKKGIDALKDKSAPLWLIILNYCIGSNPDMAEIIFRDGLKQQGEISQALKPKYIQWLADAKGTEVTRREYLQLAQKTPYCKELHFAMSKTKAGSSWEKVQELTCSQFGKNDIDVWLQYVEFHLQFNKDNDMHTKIGKVYQEAMRSLPLELTFDFSDKFSKLC